MRETTDYIFGLDNCHPYFNPRPPCGRRPYLFSKLPRLSKFQPTSPVRETTPPAYGFPIPGNISTHVPRAGDDVTKSTMQAVPPGFQSTSPVRETTPTMTQASPSSPISTHVPRAGDDRTCFQNSPAFQNFNPRPPCGRRRLRLTASQYQGIFQPTSPVRETTWILRITKIYSLSFQPTSPVRETTPHLTKQAQSDSEPNK